MVARRTNSPIFLTSAGWSGRTAGAACCRGAAIYVRRSGVPVGASGIYDGRCSKGPTQTTANSGKRRGRYASVGEPGEDVERRRRWCQCRCLHCEEQYKWLRRFGTSGAPQQTHARCSIVRFGLLFRYSERRHFWLQTSARGLRAVSVMTGRWQLAHGAAWRHSTDERRPFRSRQSLHKYPMQPRKAFHQG
jgi:hypothetical protein